MKRKAMQDGTAKPIRIESVDQLQALIDSPLMCRFNLDQHKVEVPVTRMSQATGEAVRKLRRAAQPPFIKERADYDHLGAAYLEARDKNEKKARALIVYSHCPAVAEKKPGLTSEDEIYNFVRGLFSENVLEIISL